MERAQMDTNPITQENSNDMMTGNRTRTNFFKNKIRPGEGLENRNRNEGGNYGDILGDDSGDSDLGASGADNLSGEDSGEL